MLLFEVNRLSARFKPPLINASTVLLTCMCILMMAFPIRVAPKKVQKGTRKWPQVIPARSKRGLGI